MPKLIHFIIRSFVEYREGKRSGNVFYRWISSSDFADEKEAGLENFWKSIPSISSSEDQNGWNELKKELFKARSKKHPVWLKYIAYGAAAILIIGLFIAQNIWLKNQNEPVEMENMMCCVTAKDSKGEFILPDGTKIWLNGSSKLYYPEKFDGAQRKVTLMGEGFFDVKKDTLRPFLVDIGNKSIEVLGTAFDVKNYSNLSYQEIILVRGAVKVYSEKHEVRLKPNERYLSVVENGKEMISVVDTEDYSHWMDDMIRFDNRPLGNIFITLGRWYNIEFDIDKSVNTSTRLSFNVKYESIDEVMRAVALLTPIRYHIDYERNIVHVK